MEANTEQAEAQQLSHLSEGNKLNFLFLFARPMSGKPKIALTLLALATLVLIGACTQKPSAEENAKQTQAIVDQAVVETRKQMTDEAAQQDVAAAKKQLAAEQSSANTKKQRRERQREIAAKPDNYASDPLRKNTAVCGNCGVVLSVNAIEVEGKGSGLGVVAGGVVGGVLGNQVGNGSGRDLATIAGVVGGAYAGNKIEKNSKKSKSYNIRVRMDAGEERTFNQARAPEVLSGDKVRIENDVVVKN